MILQILNLLLSPVIELSKWLIGKFQKPNPKSIIERRTQLKLELEENLPRKDTYGVRTEAIIRDLGRIDYYPKIDMMAKGISPWFRVEVKDLYHRGLEVFLSSPQYIKRNQDGEWEFTKDEDKDKILAFPVGRIPYEVIQHIDWEGDEFYPIPHLYCTFTAFRKQPYEEIVFYAKKDSSDYLYLVEGFKPWNRKKAGWLHKLRQKHFSK